MLNHFILLLIGVFLANEGFALTVKERSELVRKFKYYHNSVKPGDKFNLIETLNGTFFNLLTEIEILQTRVVQETLVYELVLIINYFDDRLVMRELENIITIPAEFNPWLPDVEVFPRGDQRRSIHIDPRTGQITLFVRIEGKFQCFSEAWKHPFEKYQCNMLLETDQDERIFIRLLRDLRPNNQVDTIAYSTEEWPKLIINFFYNGKWHSYIVTTYLPSILIFSVVVFAQWKRRKVQIMVTISAIASIVFMQSNQRRFEQITMLDLWLSGILLHMVIILTINLSFPSKRIIETTISSTEDTKFSPLCSHFATFKPLNPAVVSQRTVLTSYIGPAGFEDAPKSVLVPLADTDNTTDTYTVQNPVAKDPVHRKIVQKTIGRKKRWALLAVFATYTAFLLGYSIIVLFLVFPVFQ